MHSLNRSLHKGVRPPRIATHVVTRRTRLSSSLVGADITPIHSILIANRGEIAIRVSKTAARHGIRTTSVFTAPDKESEHILASPFSVNLGDATAYLNGDKIIEAAKAHECDAVHPGYGFLSENATFAKLCAEAGLNFIGPSWESIEAMGDKSRSKEIMSEAHVPCTPGYHGGNQDPSFLEDEANRIGYPVLLKAAHGGGGKGMRIAHTPSEFHAQLESAKSEARNSFGNDTMLVEKYITRPRHVEVQVFGDKHGNVVALGERDCSIQRRHQKIIEESPAPGLSDFQRKDLWQKAVQAAKAVNYVGAGTVEFILDADTGGFYFMEMNTRLQVEHPVTEMCTGLDLVEWQIRVARGEPLPFTQAQVEQRISQRGHAIEARIYAEDPAMDFLPTAGTLTHLRLPPEVDGDIRIDTAIKQAPSTISSYYDPMISKLIVHADDRNTALRKLRAALEQYEVAGLTTNIEFLKQLCLNPAFVTDFAELDTGFIKKHHAELFSPACIPPEVWAQAALGLVLCQGSGGLKRAGPSHPLGLNDELSSSSSRSVELALAANPLADASPSVKIESQQVSNDKFKNVVLVTDPERAEKSGVKRYESVTASAASTNNPRVFTISSSYPHTNLTSTLVLPSPSTDVAYKPTITLFDRGTRYDFTIPPPAWLSKALGKSSSSIDEASVTAPMPSKILRVEVIQGDEVMKDQPLVVVESMKMEMSIRAPRDGLIVKRVMYSPGEICKAGAVLVEFEDQNATELEES